jgi:glycosyl transferase family 25
MHKNIHIYVITLKTALDRQKRAREQLDNLGLSWSFIDAVDGRLIEGDISEYPRKKVKRLLGFELTSSEVGCFLSHKLVWKRIIETQKIGLILEDDFMLLEHFPESLGSALGCSSDWDLLRMQALRESEYRVIIDAGEFLLVENDTDPLGATAYMLTPAGADKLLAGSKEVFEPLDHYLEHKNKHGLKMLALIPYSVSITGMETTIPDRPYADRHISGFRKKIRSVSRVFDRLFSDNPWFPK